MTSATRPRISFEDIRRLLAPIKFHQHYCHTFAFLAGVWACEESSVRNLQLSAREISRKRFELVRVEVERILKEETSHRKGDIPHAAIPPM